MSSCYFTILSHIVAEASFEVNGIYGRGNADFSDFIVPVRIDLRYPYEQPGFAIELRELRCRVAIVTSGYILPPITAPLKLRVTSEHPDLKNQTVYLEIPLDHKRVASLERSRQGGDLQLRLDCELMADELVELAKTKTSHPASVWGLKEHHSMSSQVPLVIPRDVWVKNVLPRVGYGVVHVVELPVVSVEACAAFQHSYDALCQAQERHAIGEYDDAVGKCRVALEPFFEPTEKLDEKGVKSHVPTLKKSWETKLGKATYDWLNGTFGAVREAANRTHHSPNAHYNQFDSQMIIAITTTLVAYAARTMSPGEKP